MDRERLREAKNLEDLWLAFSKTKDENSLFSYLHLFVDYYSRSLNDDASLELSNLPYNLLGEISAHLLRCNNKTVSTMGEQQRRNILTLVKVLSTLARNAHNIALIASLSVVSSIYQMLDVSTLQKKMEKHQTDVLVEFVLFLERLFDPYCLWQARLYSSSSPEVARQEFQPAAVDGVVITLICECCGTPDLDYDLKNGLIDLIGCIIIGSQRNATLIICEAVLDKLCNVLVENDMTVLRMPTGLRRNLFLCFTLMVHILHKTSPEMRQVEVCDIVNRYLMAIEGLHKGNVSDRSNSELFIPLLDTIRAMVTNQKDAEGLKASFASANALKRLVDFVDGFQMVDVTTGVMKLHKALLNCLKVFFRHSKVAKTSFAQSVGYDNLLRVLRVQQPDRALLTQLIDMATEKDDAVSVDDDEDNSVKIKNPHIIAMLLAWVPHITYSADQAWLAKSLNDLVCNSEKNRMICCDHGIILAVLMSVRATTQSKHATKTTGILMSLVERLGSLSITAAELKCLVALLQLRTVHSPGAFNKRILQAFAYMTGQQRADRPLCYFSLPGVKSAIKIPDDRRPDLLKSGFTFHCWLCLEASVQPQTRRVIYSFQSSNGGFEAFVNHDGFLHVALIADDNSFYVVDVPQVALADGQWHMLDIIHSVRSSDWKITVYIDGTLRKRSALSRLNLRQKVSYSIGGPISTESASPPVESVNRGPALRVGPLRVLNSLAGMLTTRKRSQSTDESPAMRVDPGHQHEQFGRAVGLHGEMATICLFKKCLEDGHIWQIFKQGANHMEVFYDNDLKSELILHFHPKMCTEMRCIDMTKYNKDGILIEGHTCLSYSIMDMIKCIGGFQVVFPLLEQISNEVSSGSDQDLFEQDVSKENSLSCFLHLLCSFIKDNEENADHLQTTNSIPIISALIQQVDGSLIDEFTLMAVQNLLHDSVRQQSALQNSLLQHILFDFRIWNHSDKWEVRVGHAQFLYNIVTSNRGTELFRNKYGVQYMLDTIRQFYCNKSSDVDSDVRTVRTALFDIIKFYVKKNIRKDEVVAFLMFIHSIQDDVVMLEAIQAVQGLLDTASNHQIYLKLFESDGAVMLYQVLVNPDPYLASVCPDMRRKRVPLVNRAAVLKLFVTLLSSSEVPDVSKKTLRLEECGIGGFITHLQPLDPPHDTLTLILMDIICKQASEPNYQNLLSVLSLSHRATPATKLALSQMLQQVLCDKPHSLLEVVKLKGWQEIVCCLLKKRVRGVRDSRMEVCPSVDQIEDEPFVLISTEDTSLDEEVRSSHIHESPLTSTSSLDLGPELARELQSGSLTGYLENPEDSSHICTDMCSGCRVQTELQTVMLNIHSKLLWDGLHGSSEDIWKERLKVFHSLKGSQGVLYVNSVVYSRLLIEYLLKECCAVVRDYAPAVASSAQISQQVLKLLYDFVCTNGTQDSCFSSILLDLTLDLLEKMTVWHQETGWGELARIGLDVLLVFACRGSSELSSIASSKINHLIRTDEVKSETEINYIIHALHQTLEAPDLGDNHVHTLQIMKSVFEKYAEMLEASIYLPNLMSMSVREGILRVGDDVTLFTGTEWNHYIDNVVTGKRNHCVRLLKQLEQEMMNLWNEVEEDYNTDWHRHLREMGESKLLFKAYITAPVNARTDAELKRYSTRIMSQAQNLRLVLEQWRSRMRFFTSKRGTWANSNTDEAMRWKMSSHENYIRMRMKLIPNDEFDDHREASHLRDTNEPFQPRDLSKNLGKPEVQFLETGTEEDDSMFDSAAINSGEESIDEADEELKLKVDCDLITMMDPIPGRLEITNKSLYFFEINTSASNIGKDYTWPLSMIINIHYRLRNLQRTAIEFFLHDQTNYLLNFTKEDRRKVLGVITRVKRSDPKFKVFGAASGRLSQVLKNTGLTEKWVRKEISNFEYLMQLNTIAGRTYNDWSQYPVFPWVLQDYASATLDLNDPSVYRDLTKPAGALHPPIEQELRNRFEEFDDPGGMVPFHHGTHYSSAAGVVTHFLVRMEPFTTKHVQLQNSRFDIADRLFFSIEASFNSVLTSLHDCKELTPDFFSVPEFLVNTNEFDLGRPAGDVALPPWVEPLTDADSVVQKLRRADDFIWMHRKALESDYVSSNLHHWIDLIFGYKQRGEGARNACNVYPAYSYEGSYDLSKMPDSRREVTERIINEFGQTPIQLIKEPHPQRKTTEECLAAQIREGKPTSILPYLDKLKCYRVDVHDRSESGNIIVAYIPPLQTRPFIGAGLDTLVSISDQGFIGMHRWQPVDGAIINKFVFDRDLLSDQGTRRLVGPFLPGMSLEPKLLAVSTDAETVYTGGYWDNSLRIYSLNSARASNRLKHVPAHYGVVTCLHLDANGEHLVTGSADTTCKVWEVSTLGEGSKPLQCLYGHDDEVTCVAISTEYDMVVSGSEDGTVNIHTVRKGFFMQSLSMPKDLQHSKLVVKEIVLSCIANIIVYTEEKSSSSHQVVRCLLRYSINGHFLDRLILGTDDHPQTISTQLVTAQDYLLYGTYEGKLYILEIHGFKRVNKILLRKPIRCVGFAYTCMSKKHSHILVGLEGTPSMMIVLVRDAEPQMRRNILPGGIL